MQNEAKRGAQEALFTAIRDQAETNMKAALRPAEKAQLLRELAAAYRMTAGGSVPAMTARTGTPAANTAHEGTSADDGGRKRTPAR